MHVIEIYSRKRLMRRRQWYWRCRYTHGIINEIVAEGGEGYYNNEDLEASLKNFINKAPVAEWKYL